MNIFNVCTNVVVVGKINRSSSSSSSSIFIKLINQRTNFITWLPDLTALGINGVSLNSQAHIFSILRTGLINQSP